MQTWQTKLNDSTRASTYLVFSEFGFKKYLDIILIAKYRYAFTRLRTSSHRLAIETGRWTKPHSTPRFDRKCQLCNTLEDDTRFFREFRVRCIRKYYWKRTKMHKFIDLFKSENSIVVKKCSYIYTKKYGKRNNVFYT